MYKFTIISLLNKKSNTFFIKKFCMDTIYFLFFILKENKPKEDEKKKGMKSIRKEKKKD